MADIVIHMHPGPPDPKMDPVKLRALISNVFVFCYLWSVGGNLVENCIDVFDSFARELFADLQVGVGYTGKKNQIQGTIFSLVGAP